MLSPPCQEFLQKLDSEINDLKSRIKSFIETNKDSKDLYNLLETEFGEDVYNFSNKYNYPDVIYRNRESLKISVITDPECAKIMKEKRHEFLLYIDSVNLTFLSEDNCS